MAKPGEFPPLPKPAMSIPQGWASLSIGPEGVKTTEDYTYTLGYYTEWQLRDYARAYAAALASENAAEPHEASGTK